MLYLIILFGCSIITFTMEQELTTITKKSEKIQSIEVNYSSCPVQALALNATYLAIGSHQNIIKKIRNATKPETLEVPIKCQYCSDVLLTRAGYCGASFIDGQVYFWNQHNKQVSAIDMNRGCIYSFAHIDESLFVSKFLKSFVVWDLIKKEELLLLKLSSVRQASLKDCSPIKVINTQLVLGDGKKFKSFDYKSGKKVFSLSGHADDINALAVGQENIVATSALDGQLRIWDIRKGKTLLKVFPKKFAYSLVFNPKNFTLFAGLNDGTIQEFDIKGNLLQECKPHTQLIRSLVITDDCRLFSGSYDEHVYRTMFDYKE